MGPQSDTIFALSTPPGVGALALLRISGPRVRDVLAALTSPPFGKEEKNFKPRYATLAPLYEPACGDMIDQALVTFFPGPHSFTGEDVAELSLHGGRAVVRGAMDALSALPFCRLAEPGEFTRRAFLNHKLDLTEAEAVADLIHAETTLQRRQALAQMGGKLKDFYDQLRDELIHITAYLEAHLDFPDEDLPPTLFPAMRPRMAALVTKIAQHLDDGHRGERVRDGVNVVILGAPNAGKSSLINLLAARDVALVSDIPGTTRDMIDVHLDLSGAAVTLTDTAGLRDMPDDIDVDGHARIEAEGIARARARAAAAPLKIVMIDASAGAVPPPDILDYLDDQALVVLNKIDAAPDITAQTLQILGYPVIPLSVRTGAGVDTLIATLTARVMDILGHGEDGVLPTRARHRAALEEAVQALTTAQDLTAPELMAEECRRAVAALSRLTGRVDVDDILDVIFHDFCIGK